MLTKNAKNIVYWTDIHGSLLGDSVRLHRSESSLPPEGGSCLFAN